MKKVYMKAAPGLCALEGVRVAPGPGGGNGRTSRLDSAMFDSATSCPRSLIEKKNHTENNNNNAKAVCSIFLNGYSSWFTV